jgi:hypothetical protein
MTRETEEGERREKAAQTDKTRQEKVRKERRKEGEHKGKRKKQQ